MNSIRLAPEFLALVRVGQKRSTIRKGLPHIERGPAEIVSGPERILVQVSEVRIKQFAELDDKDAKRDGFETMTELLAALRRFYPDLAPGTTMTIIDFHLADEG